MHNVFFKQSKIPFLQVLCKFITALFTVLLMASCEFGKDAKTDTLPKRVEGLVVECYKEHKDVRWITLSEFLVRKETGDWLMLDVRTKDERDISFIPDSVFVDDVKTKIEEHRGENILVYCTVGCRSGVYAGELQKRGFKVFNLHGGVLAWALSGRTFETPDGKPTRKVHVFGKKWLAVPPGYEAVW